jgi:hypothetical protein
MPRAGSLCASTSGRPVTTHRRTASLTSSLRLQRARRVHGVVVVNANENENDFDREHFSSVRFDGMTPETRAARALTNLLTMAAVRVLLDQMTGTRHRSPMAPKLIDYLQTTPLRNNAETWLAGLMEHEELDYRLVAVRVIEIRKVLAETEEGFDYDWMAALARDGMTEDNMELSRELLSASLFGESERG